MASKRQIKEENQQIMLKNKQDVVELENFYVNGTFADLPALVEEKKNELIFKIDNFQANYIQKKYDKYDNVEKIVNPYLISTYFFKSLNPISSVEPTYSAEKLSIVWDLYMYLIEQVNMEIGEFQPTLTHFAKFAGISMSTLRNYRNIGDANMVILIEKIYDEIQNSNFTLAQGGKLKEKTTLTRLKVENEIVEKTSPNVNVKLEAKVDLESIKGRLEDVKLFNSKRG